MFKASSANKLNTREKPHPGKQGVEVAGRAEEAGHCQVPDQLGSSGLQRLCACLSQPLQHSLLRHIPTVSGTSFSTIPSDVQPKGSTYNFMRELIPYTLGP
jgi:hypothetical protein